MFGKVQEDSFQTIFDMSFEDSSYDSKSLGVGLGLSCQNRDGSPSLLSSVLNDQHNDLSNSNSIWGNSLLNFQDEEDLCYNRKMDSFTSSQFEQLQTLQQLTISDSAFVSPGISSPTSSTSSTSSFNNSFDILALKSGKQQRRQNLFSKSLFLHSGNSDDSFSDTCSSSSVSSSCSSGSSKANVSTAAANRYKTELCRPFQENGACKYGDKCQFAHGTKELRTVARHPKYKTDLCRTYHSSGFCPYGPRCHFIHNLDESANNDGNKANTATKRMGGNKEKEPGQVPQLPMFSSAQRSSPDFLELNMNEEKSPYLAHSSTASIGSRPAPFAGATGNLLRLGSCSGASTNGGDAAENQMCARLPVFSTLFH